jgi:succinate dehydrogenase/fumarate reductase flavoprotein subunit
MQGKDPFYFSLEHLPDDFQKRIEVEHADERLVSLKIAGDRGFNPRTHWYELMDNRPFELHTEPGIWTNANFETSVRGVYAIGDCVAGCHDVAAAATSGFIVGDNMRNIVSAAKAPIVDEDQVAEQKQAALAPLKVKDGTEPMELECAIRYLCTRYVGMQKSEGKLKEGLRRLGSLRRVFLPQQMAKNSHYLMRALEVRNLMDVAEVHMQACLERRETRGSQFRLDYKETNPIWDGMLLFQRLDQGKAVIEFKKPAKLNMEFREKR